MLHQPTAARPLACPILYAAAAELVRVTNDQTRTHSSISASSLQCKGLRLIQELPVAHDLVTGGYLMVSMKLGSNEYTSCP